MYKSCSFVRPMIIVASDGYIIYNLCHYFADGGNNDATIIKKGQLYFEIVKIK